VAQQFKPTLRKGEGDMPSEASIRPEDIEQVAQLIDPQSARMLWYLWGRRHASLDELKKISGDASHIKVLSRIRERINPAARHVLGKPIVVFERSAMDYYTGEHVFYSWWLNDEATSPESRISSP
jgi:hypothetical protein